MIFALAFTKFGIWNLEFGICVASAFTPSASSTSGISNERSRRLTNFTVSGWVDRPGPTAKLETFLFSMNSLIGFRAEEFKVCSFVSGKGKVINSAICEATIGYRLIGQARVTNPAPLRKTARAQSKAAPLIPREPAITKT